jgi:heme o synthase
MTSNSGKKLKYYLELSKFKIMIPVSLTGFTGYFLFNPALSFRLVFISLGILLIAISASVLNQIQEVDLDNRMTRTQNRPLPARKILLKDAFAFLLLCFVSGMSILYLAGNVKAVMVALLTMAWYNGIYTNLKRITAFAVVPGAITGALPPLIGWVAAGGGLWDKNIIFLEFLLFTGQIPHFWLLILKYGAEYKEAGVPSLTDIFTYPQVNRLIFTWVVFSVVAALFLCYFEIIRNWPFTMVLIVASMVLIWMFSDLLNKTEKDNYKKKYSIYLDIYFLLILLLLISDRIIS